MKRFLPLVVISIALWQACRTTISEEDLRDSIEVIRAADSMLKLDAARDTLGKDGTIKDSTPLKDTLQH